MGLTQSLSSLSRSTLARKYIASNEHEPDGAVLSSQLPDSLEDMLVPSSQSNEQRVTLSSLAGSEDGRPTHARTRDSLYTSTSLPVSVPSPTSKFPRAYSESQVVNEEVNEETHMHPYANSESLPSHVERRISELVTPSNAISKKVRFKIRCVGTRVLFPADSNHLLPG